MLGFLLFATSFTCFFMVTTIFPNIPPGGLLIDAFSNSQTNSMIAGMPSDTFISAIINGFSWALIVTLVVFYILGPENKKSELPIWVPRYANSDNSKDDQ